MIPYFDVPRFHIFGWTISSFLLLVCVGVVVVCLLAAWRGRRMGLPIERLEELCFWSLAGSFLGARLGAWVYRPDLWGSLWADPTIALSGGLSSLGGFVGGMLGLGIFFLRHKTAWAERWRYLDTLAFALPFGGILGRLGCSLVHDHPGLRSTSLLAVRYPDAPRWDLGFVELLFHIAMAAAFVALASRARAAPFFGIFFVAFGAFRLAIDPLRVDPVHFGWFTVDQYTASALLVLGGAIVYRYVLSNPGRSTAR